MSRDEHIRGILTQSDREYLRGERELTEGAEYNTRRRIYRRLRSGVLDATLIFQRLPEGDIRKAFRVADDQGVGPSSIATARTNLLALLHLSGCLIEGQDVGTEGFGRQLEKGIERSFGRQGREVKRVSVTIDVEIGDDIEDLSPADLAQRFPIARLREMLVAGVISDEEFTQAWEEKTRGGEGE